MPRIARKNLKGLLPMILLAMVSLLLLTFSIYHLVYFHKIYPRIAVASVPLGGQTKSRSIKSLEEKIKPPTEIVLTQGGQNYPLPVETIDFSYNFVASVDKAYALSRFPKIFPSQPSNLSLVYYLDEEKLNQFLEDTSSLTYKQPVSPAVTFINGQIVVEKGKNGQELDKQKAKADLYRSLALADFNPIEIKIKNVDVELSQEQADKLQERASNLVTKKLVLKFEDSDYSYTKANLLKFVKPEGDYSAEEIETLIGKIAGEIEREPQNPVFKFENGLVQEFLPAVDGIELRQEDLQQTINAALAKLENSTDQEVVAEIPVYRLPPPNKTEDVNTLGIKELVSKGVSYFRGSISSRIYNISLASSKFNGLLIAPGETLSFNKIVGDVSLLTGYQQAYIIKEGKTILGDGGGVCQVSTTLFRAALNAGLPILERRAHAYRVAYYEQNSPVGLDATVYDPSPDLKIKNDTANHLLIQTKVDKKNLKLTFEFYGTKDSRQVEISKPMVSQLVPPPEDLYTDDPSLPTGQIKQIDWKAWGSKVVFNYTVTRNGETLFKKTFVSNYQPWQAKFLRGTGPSI